MTPAKTFGEGAREFSTSDYPKYHSTEVMQLLATDRFDVLLLDNWMPELNGIELCKQVRTFDQGIPIFFCSGAVTEADKRPLFLRALKVTSGSPLILTNSL